MAIGIKRPARIFYGWWILGAGFVANSLLSATTSYGTSLFLGPLIAEFGWSRTAAAAALSFARVESGLTGPFEGVLVDRWGPRKAMLLGIPIAALGFFMWSQISAIAAFTGIDVLLVFYFVYVAFCAFGASLGSATAINVAVVNWFVRRRGLAMGFINAGHGFGAAVWVPVLAFLIQEYGWRWAVGIQGAAVLLIGIPAALVMRHRPEQYGMRPDGDPPDDHLSAGATAAPADRHGSTRRASSSNEPEFTLRQALRTTTFWCLAGSFALRVMATNAVQVHLVLLLVQIGMEPLAAAGALAGVAGLSVPGRFGMGWLGDLFDRRAIYIVALVALIIGLFILAVADQPWQIIPFLILYAPAYGGLASLPGALRADFFGRRNFGAISGAMAPAQTFGTVTGPLFAGFIYDTTGGYKPAMITFVALCTVSLVLMLMARRPKAPTLETPLAD